jgi:hypothetical protein
MANVAVLNTDAAISAKTVTTNETSETITGVKTFDISPAAPFAVTTGSAVVANLDADKVDGLDAVNWTAFTPVWTNLTVGDGTSTGKYARLGNVVWFKIDLVWGSTTSITNAVSVAFPVTAVAGSSHSAAHGEVIDLSTGDAFWLHGRLSSTTVMALFVDNGTKLVSLDATVPATWTTSDEFHFAGMFEAA